VSVNCASTVCTSINSSAQNPLEMMTITQSETNVIAMSLRNGDVYKKNVIYISASNDLPNNPFNYCTTALNHPVKHTYKILSKYSYLLYENIFCTHKTV
jgi:hypothetical protein